MFEYQDSIEIHRPVADVFAYLIEAKNVPKWVETTVDAWQVSDGPVGLGTRQAEMVASPFSKSKDPEQVNWEISEFEENRLVSFENYSRFGYQKQSFALDPTELGTRLQVNGTHRFQGSRRFVEPVIGFFIKRERRKHLLNLKQIMESGRRES
jgi:uncharacterized protein YndB with AHSA1/START domain